MKNKIFLFLLPILAAAWLLACNKDKPGSTKQDPCPWPDITTEGLNTFGCKINGMEWVPCVDLYGLAATLRPIDCKVRESDGSNFLSISLTRSVEDSTFSAIGSDGLITMGFKPIKTGNFSINNDMDYSSVRFSSWEEPKISYELIDSSAINYLSITHLDTSTNTISGQFQITLIDEQTGKKVEITNGRFDLAYYQQ